MDTETASRSIPDPSVSVHKHGFVRLVETMGSDNAIVQAARVSYGEGTKNVRNDRALIRYLMRHRHTSPFEMCDLKFHIKLPIFVMRQLVRHRTASINEYSGRYSVMSDDFYVPEFEYLKPQSQTNKQGRDGAFSDTLLSYITKIITDVTETARDKYKVLIGRDLTRELSRIILPVSNYTECYWKINLHNLFHFLKLRLDEHAQQEITDFADVIWSFARSRFPIASEAFDDYIRGSITLSRMDVTALKDLLQDKFVNEAAHYGMSKRELSDFNTTWRT